MVEIFYNNKNAFSGISPTPMVSMSSDFLEIGSEWNQITKISLEGNLTGKFLGRSSFDLLNESYSLLANNFAENFKNFEIKESGLSLYSGANAIIENIDVSENNFYGLCPFTVNIAIYDTGVYQNFYGIKNPTDVIDYQEEGNSILKYTRKISAQGFNSENKNAITRAKEWVANRKNLNHNLEPMLCKNNNNTFLLVSERETVNRFDGTYSLDLDYVKDIHSESIDGVLFSYSVDLSYDEDSGLTTAKIKGKLSNNDINIIRSKFNSLQLFNICNNICIQSTGKSLKDRLISHSIEEDGKNSLTFEAEYNDDESLSDVIEDISIDIDFTQQNCTANISVSNNISCNVGPRASRWTKVLNAFNNFKPYNYASQIYLQEFGGTLSSNIKSEFIEHNEFDSTIKTRTSFSDERLPYGADEYVDSMQCSVNYKPSVTAFVPKTSAFTSREHNIQNLGVAPRSSIDISINIKLKAQVINSYQVKAENLAAQEVNRIKSNYLGSYYNTANKESSLRRWVDNSEFSISETWSFEGEIYSEII